MSGLPEPTVLQQFRAKVAARDARLAESALRRAEATAIERARVLARDRRGARAVRRRKARAVLARVRPTWMGWYVF